MGGGRRPWQVLVVDDDPEAHLLIKTMMELDGGFEVVAGAATGATAPTLARIHQPDAVVLDLSMPDVDGWAALPELRREVPDAVIVAFSAYPDMMTLVNVLAAGADAYLNKASSWELIGILRQLLSDRSELR